MMHYQILLALAATVSAIDTYFHLGSNCDGPSAVCTNTNPGFCCTASSSNSAAFRGIPTNWNINGQAYISGGCGTARGRGEARGSTFICIRSDVLGPITGARYEFASRKRDEVADAEETPCTTSQRVNEFHLPDGTRYNIADLEDDVLNEL